MAAAAFLVTGCGNGSDKTEATQAGQTSEAAGETKSEEELTDEASIQLGEYKGMEITSKKAEVTDEHVANQLAFYAEQFTVEVTDRAARERDTVNIDYVGTKDGVAFDGGTAEGFDLLLGSGRFIDGFEDGVIGMEIGEEKDLNLTFPDPYTSEELAGADVVFHVTLNGIQGPSPIDDELAKKVLGEEDATLSDLTASAKEELEMEAEILYFNNAGSEVLNQVVAGSEITCDPDAVETMHDQLKSTYSSYAAQYGVDLPTFLETFVGVDEAGLEDNARILVEQEMALNEIIKKENIVADDAIKEKVAQMNYFETADELVTTYGEEAADRLFEMGAAYQFLIDNAKEK